MNVKEYRELYEAGRRINPELTEEKFREMYEGAVNAGVVVLPEVQGY